MEPISSSVTAVAALRRSPLGAAPVRCGISTPVVVK